MEEESDSKSQSPYSYLLEALKYLKCWEDLPDLSVENSLDLESEVEEVVVETLVMIYCSVNHVMSPLQCHPSLTNHVVKHLECPQ